METFSKLLESVDGNVIEYCILAGIVVLVIILICSIVSCVKSLGSVKTKKDSYVYDDEVLVENNNDNVNELIGIAESQHDREVSVEVVEEVKIAEKIEIPEIIDEKKEAVIKIEEKTPKLDIQSITREMELKLEEETIDLDVYEDEQEKTAIISYKELLAAASKIEANALNEEILLDDEIVFEFDSKKIAAVEQLVVETQKKFKPTIDISPVFGTKKVDNVEHDEVFEIEEINEETSIENRENFLKNLQDFRSNLD